MKLTADQILMLLFAWGVLLPWAAHSLRGVENQQAAGSGDRSFPARCISFAENRLSYARDTNGNQVPDFSYCGYRQSEVAIPQVAVRVVVAAGEGDDTRRIQQAVDYVAKLPVDEDGFRGAVLLQPGEFQVSKSIIIKISGIVLRGSGAEVNGTTIRGTGKDRRAVFVVKGNETRSLHGEPLKIIDERVPVGGRSLTLPIDQLHGTGLQIGDTVIVTRPSTKEWIQAIGCDAEGIGWRPGSRDIHWDRTVTRVDRQEIELDAPLTTAIELRFGGGRVQGYTWPNRLSKIGIEDLCLVSDFDDEKQHDEEHAWFGVTMDDASDGWVRRVQFRHFAGGAVLLGEYTKNISVEDCASFAPVSEEGGYRRHTYFTLGQQCLFLRCWSEQGRHVFSVGHCAAGPNAFVNCYAARALADSGPLESWASGVLYDNVRIDGADLRLVNRWTSPPSTGWSAANCMLWQCQAASVHCYRPPTAHNWAVGNWARPAGDGAIEQLSEFVNPLSLYQQQLRERVGKNAAERIGPFLLKPTGATNPTAEQAARFTRQSNEPAKQLIDVIRQRWRSTRVAEDRLSSHPLTTVAEEDDADVQLQTLQVKNGWLTVDDQLKTGGHYVPQWWRGALQADAAVAFGPNVTRFVPGREGVGLTDDLGETARWMSEHGIASYDHHYGLWYDRRRDDHLMVRRGDGDVAPPFYEQPFARTGHGNAWDGLSRYDLTRFNPSYWNRLKNFAALCDRQGHVLFHQNYF